MSKFSKKFFKVVFFAIALVVLILLFSLNDNLDWFSRFTLCKMLSFSIAAATFFSAYHPKLIQAPHSGFFFSGVAFNYCALYGCFRYRIIHFVSHLPCWEYIQTQKIAAITICKMEGSPMTSLHFLSFPHPISFILCNHWRFYLFMV